MKTAWAFVAALVLASALPASSPAREASEAMGAHPLAVGAAFPNISLSGALSPAQAESLGLPSPKTPVPVNAIRADALVIEVFSMYCPFCQKEAPTVNALHDLIGRRGLSNRVKLIGIGAGNSETEVDVFRNQYDVAFPLFSDAGFAAHKALGEVGTPYFYVLKKGPDGSFTVVHGSLGRMESPEAFLSEITRKTGL